MERYASIDIGTNTILLLIAEVKNRILKPIYEEETIVRLGEGLQQNGFISSKAMQRGLKTLKRYIYKCREKKADKIYAIGTSALREAKNSKVFLELVKEKLNLSIHIISGKKEAYLSFLSVSRDIKNPKKTLMVIDIGGGSTEFILGRGDKIIDWVSLPIGSVRLTENFIHSDPVMLEDYEQMEYEINKMIKNIPQKPSPNIIVAVGGTATTLASVELGLKRFDIKKIHQFILDKDALKKQLELYSSLNLNGRRKIPGLSPSRADVILAGGMILYRAMEKLKCQSIMVSCHGIRYGVLYEKLLKEMMD